MRYGVFSLSSRVLWREPVCGLPELRCVGQVEFVDLLIYLIGRKAGGRHVVAQFISLVRVNRCRGIPVYEYADIRSRSHQPILVHARRMLPDTEGAGRTRGAVSKYVEYGPDRTSLRVAYVSDGG